MTHDGRTLRMLTLIDEYTRECLTIRVARRLGLKVIGWTARGFDTQRTDPDRIVARIVRQLRPGAIILLHDGGIPAERLVATVKALLASLHQQEYEVVRLDQLLSK